MNVSGPARALAIYPLAARTLGRDVSLSGNPAGILINVRPAPGPDRGAKSSTRFFGRSNSYVNFPNKGRLDARYSITLLAWVYPEGRGGPIFSYGVDFSVVGSNALSIGIRPRRRRVAITPLRSPAVLKPRQWNYVGASYDGSTGIVKLYLSGRVIAQRQMTKVQLATNNPARMGAINRHFFRGRVSCMQVYSGVLSIAQIIRRKTRCFRKGKNRLEFS